MKQTILLTIILLLFIATCFSQTTRLNQSERVIPQFNNLSDEIEYYLNETPYYKQEGCVVSPDQEKLSYLRLLAKENNSLFLSIAKKELENASAEKTKQLVWVLIQAGSKETQPLSIFTQQSLQNNFSANSSAITSALNDYLKFNYNDPQSAYVIESLVALRDYSAVPTILRMLNEESNPSLEKTMTVLVDLSASEELAEFVQAKMLEVLCDKNGYGVVNGVPLVKVLQTLEILSEDSKTLYAKHFQQIRNELVANPDEKTLTRFANKGKTERLRGTSILLLAVFKSETGKRVILEHLRTDSSKLVRAWAAQCFAIHPTSDSEVVDALIETYHSDKEHDVRWASISSLGNIGGEKAEIIIKEALGDKSLMIKESAERIIRWIEEHK